MVLLSASRRKLVCLGVRFVLVLRPSSFPHCSVYLKMVRNAYNPTILHGRWNIRDPQLVHFPRKRRALEQLVLESLSPCLPAASLVGDGLDQKDGGLVILCQRQVLELHG